MLGLSFRMHVGQREVEVLPLFDSPLAAFKEAASFRLFSISGFQ